MVPNVICMCFWNCNDYVWILLRISGRFSTMTFPPPSNPLFFWATKEELEGTELGSGGNILSVEEYMRRASPERSLPFPIVKWYDYRRVFYPRQHAKVENSLLIFAEEEWKTLMAYLVPSKIESGWFDEWEKD